MFLPFRVRTHVRLWEHLDPLSGCEAEETCILYEADKHGKERNE
jgi:hypothetical protein